MEAQFGVSSERRGLSLGSGMIVAREEAHVWGVGGVVEVVVLVRRAVWIEVVIPVTVAYVRHSCLCC